MREDREKSTCPPGQRRPMVLQIAVVPTSALQRRGNGRSDDQNDKEQPKDEVQHENPQEKIKLIPV